MSNPVPPAVLDLPLRDRAKLPAVDLPDLDRWAQWADARFRACTELRPAATATRVGVKDTVDVAGFATRLGLRRHRRYPLQSAAVLRGLPAQLVTAKLVTTELNIGMEHGCVNPYFPHLDPAGSSTGCAVAVAAGICDAALGTDTVASVRLPAAACGVVGLRLTNSAALLGGTFELSARLDAPGWITRTVGDLSHLWQTYDLSLGRSDRAVPGGRLAVGVVEESLEDDLEPEIRAAIEAAASELAGTGHRVRRIRLGELFRQRGLAYQLCARQAADNWDRHRGEIADELAPATLLALESGRSCDDDRYAELIGIQAAYQDRAARKFDDDEVDVWLLPAGTMMPRNLHTEPAPASTIPDPAELASSPRVNYAAMASLLGLPSLTFPVGYSPGFDAPISLQLVGPQWTEGRLIGAAGQLTGLLGQPCYVVGGALVGATA